MTRSLEAESTSETVELGHLLYNKALIRQDEKVESVEIRSRAEIYKYIVGFELFKVFLKPFFTLVRNIGKPHHIAAAADKAKVFTRCIKENLAEARYPAVNEIG